MPLEGGKNAHIFDVIDSGLNEGAKAVVGGRPDAKKGYFVRPTVLTDTKPEMKVIREEIFGPVVCAMPFAALVQYARPLGG